MPRKKKNSQPVDNTVEKGLGDQHEISESHVPAESDPAERSRQGERSERTERSEARQPIETKEISSEDEWMYPELFKNVTAPGVREGQGTGAPTLTVAEREQLAMDHEPYTFDETEVLPYAEWLALPLDERNVIGVHFTEGWIVLSNPLEPEQPTTPDGDTQPASPSGATRLAVFGSDNWEQPETIARTLLNWWLDHDRPTTTLVIGGDNKFDWQSKAIFNEQKFTVEEHPLNPDVSVRSARRAQISGILELQIDYAIVFIRNGDRWPLFAGRYAETRDIPTTVIRVDDDDSPKLGLFLR